jgi:glycogen debranching enzyme
MLSPMGLDPRFPHELTHVDWTVLLSHPDGSIHGDDGCGLYYHDCRILSRLRLTVDDAAPEWVSSGAVAPDEWIGSLRVERPGPDAEGPALPQDALEIRIHRRLGRGLVEVIEVLNHSMVDQNASLALELAADFADLLEVGQERRQQSGDTTVALAKDAAEVRYHCRKGEFETRRGIRVRRLAGRLKLAVADDGARLTATIRLKPHGQWRARIAYEPLVDGQWRRPDGLSGRSAALRAERRAWQRSRPLLQTPAADLSRAFRVAEDDVFDLRNRELEQSLGEPWVLNAGVPLYTGLFGRDVLTAGWQSALVGTDALRGALAITARLQATDDDPWSDSEPGKLIHELRRGPFADLHVTAQSGYYGTQTTAAMFPLVLSELWHWTADDEPLRRFRETAERALDWAERFGDLDGDGFLEYRQRSPVGIKNQAWKDSHEAIRYPDGRNVPNPIATVEEQAFHYLALLRMAQICTVLDDDAAADSYLSHARLLREQWHEAFWMPDEGFYAMALDPDKKQVKTIGSNIGHALAAGIVPRDNARAVAERLMADDMFSGWGIRTLSAQDASYNPWGYHLGPVWPVENATFALGLKRYGFDDLVDRLVTAQLEAAALLPEFRLPELIGGQSRTEMELPVAYPQANAPQAWSASATIQLLQIMLGLYPFAPMRVLTLVRPRLPRGVDSLTLRRVRVGDASVSLRFTRREDGSADHEVIARRGKLLVVAAPPPDAADKRDIREIVAAAALAHAPGKLARAGRIALGIVD